MDECEILPVRHHLDEDTHVTDAPAAGACTEDDDIALLHVGISAFHGFAVAGLVPGRTGKLDAELAVYIAGESRAVERLRASGAIAVGSTDMLVSFVYDKVSDLRCTEGYAVAGGRRCHDILSPQTYQYHASLPIT